MQLLIKLLENSYLLFLSLGSLFIILGALFILFGIAGKVETKWFTINVSKWIQRLPLNILGLSLIVLGLFLILRPMIFCSKAINIPTIPVKSRGLSEFGNEWPRNNYGREWKIFNDSKWFGKSIIWYEMVRKNQNNDYFMRIHFKLGNPPPTPAYCGIYTEFSDPPYGILDLSAYNGIEFEARYKAETPNNPVKFFLQIAVLGIPNYEYHEAEFTIPEGLETFTLIRIPFSQLKTPIWAGTQYEFDKSRIFRIGLVIKGNRASGILDFDNLRLIK